ncbi:hypothetical protein DRD23_09280 [Salmonella enterica subsp. enterica serovar Enteritidis]|nr:hypothetical protein [Salmonella enterica subsp. enterica serovar Enteritidis]
MSLLTLIREEAIIANVQKGGETWKMITECMRSVAKAGDPNVRITVSSQNPEEVQASVKALQLMGFYADFQNEGRREIYISWRPRQR